MSAFEKFLDAAFAEEEDHNDDSDNDHDDDNDDDGLVGGVVDVEPVSIQEIKEEEQQQELLDATPFDVHHHPDDYLINDADEMNDPVHGVNEDAYTANDVNNPYYHSYNTTPVNPLATTTMNRTRNLDSLLSLNHNHMTTSNTTTTTNTLPATKLVEDDTNSVMDRALKIEDMRKRVEAQLEALTRGNDFQQLRLQVAQLRTGTTNTMITKANIIPTTNTTTTTTTMGIAPPSMLPMTLPTVTTGTRTMENTAWTNSSFSEYDLDFGVEHQLSSPKQHHSRRKSSNRSLPIPDTPIVTTTTGPIAPMMTIHPINDNEDLLQPIPIDLTKTKKEHMTSKASTTKLMATTSGTTTTTATTATITTTTAQMVGDTVYVQGVDLVDPYGDAGTYTGEVSVVKRKPHGVGEMTYQDGRIYSGGWNQGQWHGKGTAVFANGDKFDGTYDMDRRHGFGVYAWKDGRIYEGEFYHDQRQGCGEYRWPDGAVYRGEFAKGHRHGEGTYTFADGSTYTGEWSQGRYHGVGQCIWTDGRVYKGEWRDGKAHGYGVEKRVDGTVRHEGMWNNDIPVRKR